MRLSKFLVKIGQSVPPARVNANANAKPDWRFRLQTSAFKSVGLPEEKSMGNQTYLRKMNKPTNYRERREIPAASKQRSAPSVTHVNSVTTKWHVKGILRVKCSCRFRSKVGLCCPGARNWLVGKYHQPKNKLPSRKIVTEEVNHLLGFGAHLQRNNYMKPKNAKEYLPACMWSEEVILLRAVSIIFNHDCLK